MVGQVGRSAGQELATGGASPVELWLVATAGFVLVVGESARLTHTRFQGLNTDLLLTTVTVRVAVTGLLTFVLVQTTLLFALPAFGIALGLAVGLQAPLAALSTLLAAAGLVMFGTVVGVAGRLVAHQLGRHLVRGTFYRDLLIVFGWIPLVAGVFLLRETDALAPLFAAAEFTPVVVFIDLALIGGGHGNTGRGLVAIAILLVGLPTLLGVSTAVTRRIWESEPASSEESGQSRSLIADGWLERVLGGHVSQPVLVITRNCWLLERRTFRGLLGTGYVVFFAGVVLPPVLFLLRVSLFVPLAVLLGLACGLVFASEPVGRHYRTLPMVLTTATGRQFVRGVLLATLWVATPVVALVTLPLGLWSPATLPETLAVSFVGIVTAVCTAAVTLAVELGVDYDEFVPVTAFFTDTPTYSAVGTAPFLRLGAVLLTVTAVAVPAFVGNSARVHDSLGVPISAVRMAGLLATIAVALLLTRVAYGIAIRRHRRYEIH